MWKMSIQYTVLGFEPTTFGTRIFSLNHYTWAPAPIIKLTPCIPFNLLDLALFISWSPCSIFFSRECKLNIYHALRVRWGHHVQIFSISIVWTVTKCVILQQVVSPLLSIRAELKRNNSCKFTKRIGNIVLIAYCPNFYSGKYM